VHATLAAGFATTATLVLPFFPRGWPFALGALAGLTALRAPRIGLAVALAAPLLPLGNLSLGLALAYAAIAVAWIALFARDAVSSLLFLVGAVLAPIGGIGLAPVLAFRARGGARRAALAGVAVLAGAGLSGAAGLSLPLARHAAPALGLAETERPAAASAAVVDALGSEPVLLFTALLIAVAAVLVPLALERGPWGVSVWGSALLATALLVPPIAGLGTVSALQLAPGAILATAWLGARSAGIRR
ncbi:MAG: hypothetical protein M3377_09010, partial [Actinomycetota bacterium]|nr:hypothetical protein [Actinomycetota bacterium]